MLLFLYIFLAKPVGSQSIRLKSYIRLFFKWTMFEKSKLHPLDTGKMFLIFDLKVVWDGILGKWWHLENNSIAQQVISWNNKTGQHKSEKILPNFRTWKFLTWL